MILDSPFSEHFQLFFHMTFLRVQTKCLGSCALLIFERAEIYFMQIYS